MADNAATYVRTGMRPILAPAGLTRRSSCEEFEGVASIMARQSRQATDEQSQVHVSEEVATTSTRELVRHFDGLSTSSNRIVGVPSGGGGGAADEDAGDDVLGDYFQFFDKGPAHDGEEEGEDLLSSVFHPVFPPEDEGSEDEKDGTYTLRRPGDDDEGLVGSRHRRPTAYEGIGTGRKEDMRSSPCAPHRASEPTCDAASAAEASASARRALEQAHALCKAATAAGRKAPGKKPRGSFLFSSRK